MMKVKIELRSDSNVILPTGFNEYIQALIYNSLNIDKAKWLHEIGYQFEKRKFKLFVFSSILEKGKFNQSKKVFCFPSNISFYIASPISWLLEQFALNLLKKDQVSLGNNQLNIHSVNILKEKHINNEAIRIKAITPIECHSTFEREGKKKTHYYTPYDIEFNELIYKNLTKKWQVFYKEEVQYKFMITPLFSGNQNERIMYFGTTQNRTLIKGWLGYFRLTANLELIKFALDVGLGSRNSQGFGMIEVVE